MILMKTLTLVVQMDSMLSMLTGYPIVSILIEMFGLTKNIRSISMNAVWKSFMK